MGLPLKVGLQRSGNNVLRNGTFFITTGVTTRIVLILVIKAQIKFDELVVRLLNHFGGCVYF